MTITSVGYGGDIDEVAWARIARTLGAEYGVMGANATEDPGACRVTAVPAADRTIRIAPGIVYGHGIFDTLDTDETLQLPPVAAGSRWDVIYVRREWSGPGGTTTIVRAPATAAGDIPTRENNPGVLDEQPIALVRLAAGQSVPQEVVDLRVWQSNGGATAADRKVLQFLTAPGTEIWIDGELWARQMGANDTPQWVRNPRGSTLPVFARGPAIVGTPPPDADFKFQAGTLVQATNSAGWARVTFPNPFPNGLQSVTLLNGDGNAVPGGFLERYTPDGSQGATLNSVAYRLLGLSSGQITTLRNRTHRVDWTAVGW